MDVIIPGIIIIAIICIIFYSVQDATNSIIKGPHWDDPDYREEIIITHEYVEPKYKEVEVRTWNCGDCNEEIEYEQTFCGGCGEDLTEEWKKIKEKEND